MRVFIFGDSLTAGTWPEQLEALMPGWEVVKDGLGGRVIGQRPTAPNGDPIPQAHPLNGVFAIEGALAAALPVDAVLIMLGTNDAQLKTRAHEGGAPGAARHMQTLLDTVRALGVTDITVVSPPPFGARLNEASVVKLGDAPNAYLETLVPLLASVAARNGVRFIDLFSPLREEIEAIIGPDGVHFDRAGDGRLAAEIANRLVGEASPRV